MATKKRVHMIGNAHLDLVSPYTVMTDFIYPRLLHVLSRIKEVQCDE